MMSIKESFVHTDQCNTAFGWLRAISDGVSLIRLEWSNKPWSKPNYSDEVSRETIKQILYYLRGDLQSFTLPLNPYGTSQSRKRWLESMLKIPFGTTVSYENLANFVGKPNSARAAGTACANNPIPIIYPCHRILRKDGSIGNYSGEKNLPSNHPENLKKKSYLIALEKYYKVKD